MTRARPEAKLVSRADRVLEETVAGTVVLFDPDTSRYMKLNPSGRVLWAEIAGESGVGIEHLTAALTANFGIGGQAAAADVDRFVDELVAAGFVRVT